MENIILVLNIVLAILLVAIILLQKSEGGALGIGVSQDSFISSRSASNFLTKTTDLKYNSEVVIYPPMRTQAFGLFTTQISFIFGVLRKSRL